MKNSLNKNTHINPDEYKVDVVIPTLGEPSLDYALKAIEKSMNINKIILVGSENLLSRYKDNKNMLVVVSNEKNVGKKRAIGLDYVETKYYASIDSDLIINKKWFKWCMKTIVKKKVAACEGFGINPGKRRSRILIDAINKGKDWQGLGGTMLKTDIIRKVGMPEKKYMEDKELVYRIRSIGYRWIFNPKILTLHLISDVDYWRHQARWGEIAGNEALQPITWARTLVGSLTTLMLKNKFTDCLFYFTGELYRFYGYMKGKIKRKLNINI